MKKQLTSFALFIVLCVFGTAYGQTGTFKLDSLNKWTTYSNGYTLGIEPAKKNNWSQYWMLNVDYKPLMTISDIKPDKSYEVWIDKKAIKWTSDSTFILKRKP